MMQINTENMDRVHHLILKNQTYVLIILAEQPRPLRFKGQAAETIWQLLEQSATIPLIESVFT